MAPRAGLGCWYRLGRKTRLLRGVEAREDGGLRAMERTHFPQVTVRTAVSHRLLNKRGT